MVKSDKEFLNLFSKCDSSIAIMIGNFDGVHLAHRKLIEGFVTKCKKDKLNPFILTFRPHPYLYFKPDANYLLSDYEERSELIENIDNDIKLIEFEFNERLQKLSAEEFIKSYLLKIPYLRLIYLGHDFALGAGKQNSFELLKQLSRGIEIYQSETLRSDNQCISSTGIRELIGNGQYNKAVKLLERPFTFSGKVVQGKGIGTKELVPTLNIDYPKQRVILPLGVYVSEVNFMGQTYKAVSNIGKNPTTDKDDIIKIESHILDFKDNLYNKDVKVKMLHFIRDEIKFDSIEELKLQIQKDITQAENYFEEN